MNTYVALLRGINLGKRNVLPKEELVAIFGGLGAKNVETYIQSGNVVFDHDDEDASRLSRSISAAIREERGFESPTLVLRPEEMERAIHDNPFPEADSDPKSLHLFFLISRPENPNLEAFKKLKTRSERYFLGDGVFYHHAPEGMARSKLGGNVERLLGVPMTARNWRTVGKIMAMLHSR